MLYSLNLRPRTLTIAALAACGLASSCLVAHGDGLGPKKAVAPKEATKPGRVAKPTLYEIGYSHLDTEWCWTYPQVIREFIPNTLHENFALFKQFPDYTFNWTGSNRYRFMKEYYPEDYATLKKYVAAGRWFPAGSSIEEGDVNSPSEESLIRQVMYGNEFFRREFGKASTEFMLPDCFGFPASLPSILAHCGLKGFSTQKLTWGSAAGIPFDVGRWIGPDNSDIIAALNGTPYDSPITTNLSDDPRTERLFARIEPHGENVDYHYYGVGDRGGGPSVRSVENLEASIHGDGPIHVVGGDADTMFNVLTPGEIAKLPSYKGDLELTNHSAGSLSSEGGQKRFNRKNELLADDTERASVVADWMGALPYDRDRITDAWLRFLPGQFHDLMAGTALPLAYTYAWNDQVIALNEFAGQLRESVGAVARGLDTRTSGTPVVVYNPLSIARQDVVEATIPNDGRLGKASSARLAVAGPDGRLVPAQLDGVDAKGAHVLFLAKSAPISVETYGVSFAHSGAAHPASGLRVDLHGLENARYRVRLNAAGDVKSIFDKKANKELLKSPLRLAFQTENPRQFPAWNMDWDDQSKPPRGYVDGPAEVKVVENGPVRVGLQITRHAEGSKFVQTIRLAAGDAGNRIEFATQIDWRAQVCALKAVFPLTVSNPEATYNWELGTIQRGNDDPKKFEVPAHKWFDLTDASGKYGVSILDDCKYGSDKPDDSTLRLTLIYTPGTRGGYQHQGTQDWGRNIMTYAIEGHEGDWRQGQTQWEAARLNQPLLAFVAPKQAGDGLGKAISFAKVSTSKVSIEAMKKAEDSDEIIVRLNELDGENEKGVRVSFHAPVVSARAVDGQERPIGPATIQNGALVADMTPYHPLAFAIKLGKPSERLRAPVSRPLDLPFNVDGVSSWAHKTDGNFDGAGESIPGELLPKSLVSDGVTFKLGSSADGVKNTLACEGQSLALPVGRRRRLYLLGASAKGDTEAKFVFGGRARAADSVRVQAWDGYIGELDTRLWGGVVPELTYSWDNPIVGLVPGYIKRDAVAWYADHKRLADGTNDIYAFCYLFRYSVPIPDGATKVILPNNPTVRLMAATVSTDPDDDVIAAQPLYDTLDRTGVDGPTLSPAGVWNGKRVVAGPFHDATEVKVRHALYWTPSDTLRYTTDGARPTAAAPAVNGEIMLSQPTNLTVAQFDANGKQHGPATETFYDVKDTTTPSILSADTMAGVDTIRLAFSEPVERSGAVNPANYALSMGTVKTATPSADGKSVVLTLDHPVANVTGLAIAVSNVADLSPAHNKMVGVRAAVVAMAPAFSRPGPDTFDASSNAVSVNSPAIPAGPTDAWTINLFIYADKAPEDHSLIAGFGNGRDDNGAERFFAKLHGGIEFWGSNVDVPSGSDVDLHRWQMWTATYDGKTLNIYKDGREIKSEAVSLSRADQTAKIGPDPAWRGGGLFDGKTAGFTIWKEALPSEYVRALLANKPRVGD